MKITHLAFMAIALGFAACASDTTTDTTDTKAPATTTAKKTPGSNPMLGTAGNPAPPSRNGQYNGTDPMSNGVDGKLYNKNY